MQKGHVQLHSYYGRTIVANGVDIKAGHFDIYGVIHLGNDGMNVIGGQVTVNRSAQTVSGIAAAGNPVHISGGTVTVHHDMAAGDTTISENGVLTIGTELRLEQAKLTVDAGTLMVNANLVAGEVDVTNNGMLTVLRDGDFTQCAVNKANVSIGGKMLCGSISVSGKGAFTASEGITADSLKVTGESNVTVGGAAVFENGGVTIEASKVIFENGLTGSQLTVSNLGELNVTGSADLGTGKALLDKGTLTVRSTDTALTCGSLIVQNEGSLSTNRKVDLGSNTLTVKDGTVFVGDATTALTAGIVEISGNTTVRLSGAVDLGLNPMMISGGKVFITGGAEKALRLTNLNISDGATVNVEGGVWLNDGNCTLSDGYLMINNENGTALSGRLTTVSADGYLSATGSKHGISLTGNLTVNGRLHAVSINTAQDATYSALSVGNLICGSDLVVRGASTSDGIVQYADLSKLSSYDLIKIEQGSAPINLTVNCVGSINYTVSGQTVTVNHSLACKVGYLSSGSYVAITAVKNSNGTYSFTAPAGVTEVVLLVKGDVSGDGKINVGDTAKLYSHVRGTAKLTDPIAIFAADVSGDGKLNVGDTAKVYSHVKATALLPW